jgi:hypothetical protein
MTLKELVDWCNLNNVSLDTHIAVRAKDDYFITLDSVSHDQAYFGNCREGTEWEKDNIPLVDGEPDYDNAPKLIVLDSGRG